VGFAGFFTTTYGDGGTFTANEFFFFEIGIIVTSLIASFSTTIIRLIAFKALIIGKSRHRKFL
jgi:hypothetical protein